MEETGKSEVAEVSMSILMMERIAKLREKYDLHMRVERYVSDEGGIPEADSRFIKE